MGKTVNNHMTAVLKAFLSIVINKRTLFLRTVLGIDDPKLLTVSKIKKSRVDDDALSAYQKTIQAKLKEQKLNNVIMYQYLAHMEAELDFLVNTNKVKSKIAFTHADDLLPELKREQTVYHAFLNRFPMTTRKMSEAFLNHHPHNGVKMILKKFVEDLNAGILDMEPKHSIGRLVKQLKSTGLLIRRVDYIVAYFYLLKLLNNEELTFDTVPVISLLENYCTQQVVKLDDHDDHYYLLNASSVFLPNAEFNSFYTQLQMAVRDLSNLRRGISSIEVYRPLGDEFSRETAEEGSISGTPIRDDYRSSVQRFARSMVLFYYIASLQKTHYARSYRKISKILEGAIINNDYIDEPELKSIARIFENLGGESYYKDYTTLYYGREKSLHIDVIDKFFRLFNTLTSHYVREPFFPIKTGDRHDIWPGCYFYIELIQNTEKLATELFVESKTVALGYPQQLATADTRANKVKTAGIIAVNLSIYLKENFENNVELKNIERVLSFLLELFDVLRRRTYFDNQTGMLLKARSNKRWYQLFGVSRDDVSTSFRLLCDMLVSCYTLFLNHMSIYPQRVQSQFSHFKVRNPKTCCEENTDLGLAIYATDLERLLTQEARAHSDRDLNGLSEFLDVDKFNREALGYGDKFEQLLSLKLLQLHGADYVDFVDSARFDVRIDELDFIYVLFSEINRLRASHGLSRFDPVTQGRDRTISVAELLFPFFCYSWHFCNKIKRTLILEEEERVASRITQRYHNMLVEFLMEYGTNRVSGKTLESILKNTAKFYLSIVEPKYYTPFLDIGRFDEDSQYAFACFELVTGVPRGEWTRVLGERAEVVISRYSMLDVSTESSSMHRLMYEVHRLLYALQKLRRSDPYKIDIDYAEYAMTWDDRAIAWSIEKITEAKEGITDRFAYLSRLPQLYWQRFDSRRAISRLYSEHMPRTLFGRTPQRNERESLNPETPSVLTYGAVSPT